MRHLYYRKRNPIYEVNQEMLLNNQHAFFELGVESIYCRLVYSFHFTPYTFGVRSHLFVCR